MKYTVMGFSQKTVMDLNASGLKIDVADLAILRWLVDFSHTEKMVKVFESGRVYYWVNYQSVLDDLPILNIGRRMLSNRMQKMVDAGILCSSLKKAGGTFTYYGFGPVFERLISQDFDMGVNQFTEGCQKNDTPHVNVLTPPMSKNLQPKYPSTKDQSTKNQSIIDNGRKRPPTRFIPPTVEEVRAYCQERKNSVDPERFVDYYQSNGWKVGKNPMKDWKAAVRTWERGDKQKGGNSNAGGTAARSEKPSVSRSGGTIVECEGGGFVRFG